MMRHAGAGCHWAAGPACVAGSVVTSVWACPSLASAKYKGKTFIMTCYEPAAIDSPEKGTLTATAPVQNVNMGRLALAHAVDVLNGNKGKRTCLPAPSLTKADIGSPVADRELYPADFKVE